MTAILRLSLVAALVVAGLALTPGSAPAAMASTRVTWDTQADFENNLPALPIPTTMDGHLQVVLQAASS